MEGKRREEIAEEIAVQASQLRRMAEEARMPFLGYLAEMVVLEAWREASRERDASEEHGASGAAG